MANLVSLIISLVAFFSIGLAARIEMKTSKSGPITKTDIKCMVDEFDAGNSIQNIDIIGPDQTTILASVESSKVSPILNVVPSANMKAHGNIDSHDVDRSYLTLTLNPAFGIDSGLYSCHIHYGVGPVAKIDRASKHLSVAKQDMELVGKYLMYQINTLNAELDNNDEERDKLQEFERQTKTSMKALSKVPTILSDIDLLKKADSKQSQDTKALQDRAKYNVAFRASYKYKYTFSRGDILKFENVELNLGKAYDGDSSIFTAPTDGVYSFSLLAHYPFGGTRFAAHIVANGKAVASGWTKDKDFGSSLAASVTVVLHKGEQVKIIVRNSANNQNLYSDRTMSVFSGHLVNPL